MKKICKLAALLALPLTAGAVNFPVGTHLVKGTLKDWENKVLTSSVAVTIQAVATNGTVIASTKVADPTSDGYNFLLQIPLSSTATDSTAAIGDRLNCVLVSEAGLSLAVSPITVGDANAVSTAVLAFVNAKTYTSKDGTSVSVAQEYLDAIAPWMEANGTVRLFRELKSAQAACENARRISTVMMSVDTPVVAAAAQTTFGDQLRFAWTVDAKASDNPFRHAWHPDHDGKTADHSGDVVSGDDLGNYVNPVKPELWSVTNARYLSWHKQNVEAEPVDFEQNPEETTAGFATWTVGGLLSTGEIQSLGVFHLKRIVAAAEIED